MIMQIAKSLSEWQPPAPRQRIYPANRRLLEKEFASEIVIRWV
jgi:hypothetical protein